MTTDTTARPRGHLGVPLWLPLLFMLLGIGAWSAWNAYADYGKSLEQEYRLLEVRARQREARIGGALRSVDLMLGTIGADLHERPAMALAERNRLLTNSLRLLPELHSLVATDAAGRIMASNNEKLIGFDAGGREYFSYHRDAPTDDHFHISLPFKTVTGITATTLSRVMRDRRGGFYGVVVATLEPSFFDDALRFTIQEQDAEAVLINRQGDILNLVPHSELIGRSLVGGIAFSEHLAAGRPTTRHLNVAKLEPVMKIAVFHAVPGAPLTVIVSRNYDAVMADWRRSMLAHIVNFVLLAMVTLLLAALAARRQRSLLGAQRQLESQLAEISELQTRLQDQVIRDPLTGLHNRRYLDEILPRELSRAKREGYALALIMIDLDHFKRVNDSYGHAAGDAVLRTLAKLLREGSRESDIICRYGGEEFLVALPRMSPELALARIEAWRRELAGTVIEHGELTVQATLSAGIAAFPEHGADIDTLLARADEALYSAKNAGRNRVTRFEATQGEPEGGVGARREQTDNEPRPE